MRVLRWTMLSRHLERPKVDSRSCWRPEESQMHRLLSNVLLLLLLIFMLPIYQANPTPEVLALGILLLAAALFLGYTRQTRGMELLAAMTAVVSFVGIAFLGRGL